MKIVTFDCIHVWRIIYNLVILHKTNYTPQSSNSIYDSIQGILIGSCVKNYTVQVIKVEKKFPFPFKLPQDFL